MKMVRYTSGLQRILFPMVCVPWCAAGIVGASSLSETIGEPGVIVLGLAWVILAGTCLDIVFRRVRSRLGLGLVSLLLLSPFAFGTVCLLLA